MLANVHVDLFSMEDFQKQIFISWFVVILSKTLIQIKKCICALKEFNKILVVIDNLKLRLLIFQNT